MTDTKERQQTLETIRKYKYISDMRFAMLTTVEANGVLRTRPMTTQQTEFDGDLWFFASKNSVQELEKQHKPQANAAYSDPEKNIYVSMSGQVEIVHDKQKIKQLWNPVVAAYFDKGADDPEVILICLHVDQVEYWDAPSSKTVRLFNLKSVVTGHHDDQGHHERVMLSDQR